ncbi:right-handed parallel beta-helix repeat-containing protein [Marinicella sp. S1101]|uniref:choice-of-anchor Q domain-containing protein n=1 Tax=Marinicella marina TaxID=2996016 RepID=UPI002260D75F|nr:choice-of-anchor Q domain-containing protein [Marinicella marina]MCX7554870.1 right-handed parallel beta-helix repeat-containing protein [Marinicella marina]MDJ1141528.1 choice-of-anchor Q domain-containing protein [Marinicella marina]
MKQKKLTKTISGILSLGTFCLAHAGGETITVTSVSDEPEAGLITLREAIAISNDVSGAAIEFDSEVFSVPQTITLSNGNMLISESVTINGPGKDLLTIDGAQNSKIFRIDNDDESLINAEINDITLTNGQTNADEDRAGGCIFSFENLTLNNSTISNCRSDGRAGAILARFGSLNINNSTVSDNFAGNDGGGVYSRQSVTVISNSTISNNTAVVSGGGIYAMRGSIIEIVNSTISQNDIRRPENNRGGGVFLKEGNTRLNLANTTVFSNTGEGIFIRDSSTINITNSIIASNSTGDCDFSQINGNSANQNNLDTDGSCDVFASNHITVVDPLLDVLRDNGGLTMTHLPLDDSPVIDAGDDFLCTEFDQRGQARPQDGDGDGFNICDIGSVELLQSEGNLIFKDGFDELACDLEPTKGNRGCR